MKKKKRKRKSVIIYITPILIIIFIIILFNLLSPNANLSSLIGESINNEKYNSLDIYLTASNNDAITIQNTDLISKEIDNIFEEIELRPIKFDFMKNQKKLTPYTMYDIYLNYDNHRSLPIFILGNKHITISDKSYKISNGFDLKKIYDTLEKHGYIS